MQLAKQYKKDHPMPPKSIPEIERILLYPIVRKIKIELYGPDDRLIEKLKEGEYMFLISRGECIVDFRRGNLNTQSTSQNWRAALTACGQKNEALKDEGTVS